MLVYVTSPIMELRGGFRVGEVWTGTPEDTRKRVLTAYTDPKRTHRNIPGTPEVCNVYSLHKTFTPSADLNEIYQECTGALRGCVDCKRQLASNINKHLGPLRDRREEFRARPGYVKEVLEHGEEQARRIARDTMAEVNEKMGLA